MPLTRLDNLISSKTGKYLYVSPDDFNATDALSNRGNSPVTPFKSIQRAFLEIARYSYLPGKDNDRFDQFSIMLMPGIHYIDNRPGLVNTTGITEFGFDQALNAWTDNSILDIGNPDNILWKFNNTEGGAIIPRGSSLVGYDLRRTVLRPLYVPDPASVTVPRTAMFNVTGGCYFWQFTLKDGQTTSESPLYNPAKGTGEVYYDPTDFTKKTAPNYSHHKLTVFEYADTEELALFYRKIAKAFSLYQPTIDDPGEFDFRVQENRIVGPLSDSRVIESLKFTDATTDPSIPASTSEIEVTTKVDHGYFAGQFVSIANTAIDDVLEGFFPIKEINANDPRKFIYEVPFVSSAIGSNIVSGQTVSIDTSPALGQNALTLAEVDSVESASPYVFNVSIRSTWGICGIWANGLKATGFRSMVIAQYTGVSLQLDDRAFIRYDEYSNTWNQASLVDAFAPTPYHAKGDSYWKDEWRTFHVRASEDAFIQNVSIFAVGFADHFLMETGGDMSITNSNSNFGNTSLHAIGFKGFSFNQDKGGYITDIIPPKQLVQSIKSTKKTAYYTIDIQGTIQSSTNYTKLFLGSDDIITPETRPAATIGGYRIGAKSSDKLYVKLDPAAGTGEVFEAELTPTGFIKYIAKPSILNPSGISINSRFADAANLIESNRTMIQEEVFGYILEKFPRLQNIPYVNPGLNPLANRYFDARNLILANRQEIVDTAFTQMTTTFGTAVIQGIADGKCKRDIGLIVDAIAEDLRDGGNANIINATKLYFNGNGTPLANGLVGEENYAVFAFNRAKDLCKKAIANLLTVKATIYDPDPLSNLAPYGIVVGSTGSAALGLNSSGVTIDSANREDPASRNKDARNRILANRDFILDAALAEIVVYHPDFFIPGDQQTDTGSRYADGFKSIRRNNKEIVDKAFAEIVINHPNFYVPGDNQTDAGSRYVNAYDLIQKNKEQIVDTGLAQIVIGHPDFYIPGDPQTDARSRYADGYRLIQENRTEIVNTAWTNMLVTYPAASTTEVKCKRDLGYFVDAVSLDLFVGGNKYARKFVSEYFVGNVPITNGLVGEVPQSNAAFEQARNLMRSAVANQLTFKDLTITAGPSTYGGSGGNIANNDAGACADVQSAITTLTTIITDAVTAGNLTNLPALTPYIAGPGEDKCRRDLGYFVDAIALDLFNRGNEYTWKFCAKYFSNRTTQITNGLAGEEGPSKTSFSKSVQMIKRAITNQLYEKDLTITADNAPGSPYGEVLRRYTPHAATYAPETGVMVLSIANHELVAGDHISFAPTSLTFSCSSGGAPSNQSYPRSTDPTSNQYIEILSATTDTITVNVGISSNTSAHTFISSTVDAVTFAGNTANQLTNAQAKLCSDVQSAVDNLYSIVDTVFTDGNLNSMPISINKGTAEGPGSDKCKRDLGYFVDAISVDLYTRGNKHTRKFVQQYFINTTTPISNGLVGETAESITAFNKAAAVMCEAVTNQLYDKDLTATAGPATYGGGGGNIPNTSSAACADVQAAITTLAGIATSAISAGNLLSLPAENAGDLNNFAGETKCRRDIGHIVDAVAQDLWFGGNEYTIAATKEYFTNATTLLVNGVAGETGPSITAFRRAQDLMNRAANNQYYNRDLTITLDTTQDPPVFSDIHSNAFLSIMDNKKFIAEEAYRRMLLAYPSYVPQVGNTKQDCLDDVYDVLANIAYDLKYGGNSKTYDAAKIYTTNVYNGQLIQTFIDAERDEAAKVFTEAKNICIAVINNIAITPTPGNPLTQVFDFTTTLDWDTDQLLPTCGSAVAAIDTLFGILVQAIGNDGGVGNLSGIERTTGAPADPAYNTAVAITAVTPNTITINLGASTQTVYPHTFVSALPGAVISGGAYAHRFVSATTGAVNVISGTQLTPANATYDPSNGSFTLYFGTAHGLTTSNQITLDDNSFTFRCAMDNYASAKTYPRPGSDPAAGQTLSIAGVTSHSITVNVGTSPLVNHNVTNAVYTPASGVVVLTIAAHGLAQGESIKIKTEALTFRCSKDGEATTHSYPRAAKAYQPTTYAIGNCSDVLATIDTLISIVVDALYASNLNTLPPLSTGLWDCANVRSSIETLFDVVTDAVRDGTLSGLPLLNEGDFVSNARASKCYRDVSYIVDAVVNDLRLGGNLNSIQAGEAYYVGNSLNYIDGEQIETLDAWNYVGQIATAAMRNFDMLAVNCGTTTGSAIVNVGDSNGILIGMKVVEYANTPTPFVNGLLQANAVPVYTNITEGTYVKRIVDGTRIELGVANARLTTGNTVNALQTSTSTKLYFTYSKGQWADTLPNIVQVGPASTNPDVIQDTTAFTVTNPTQRECADVASAITTLVGNITTIIGTGLGTVASQPQTVNTALLSSRATLWTIDTTGYNSTNPHQFETGTPVRLVPRPRFNVATGKYVDVDKRLVRLPNGFVTNQIYYVIAPGRITQPNNFASNTLFNVSAQTNIMLATSKENAAAGIYIYASEAASVDQDVEIDIYQFILDQKYDLHNYQAKLSTTVSAGIETEISHIFDVPYASVTPQQVFIRKIEGGSLPIISTTYANDPQVAVTSATNADIGRINPLIEFFVRYQNEKTITLHKTHADAINNVNPITFASGQSGVVFDVWANKRRSPMKFDPAFTDNKTTSGKWYIQCKDTVSAQPLSTQQKNIFWRLLQSDYADRPRSTDMWYERLDDTRVANDRTYKVRYVIPKYLENARDPISGFVIKTRTDDTRKLVPQKVLLKPVTGSVYGARFENPTQAGEYIGFTRAQLQSSSLNISAAYDPYKRDLSGAGIEYRAFAKFNSGIQATIQSAKYVTDRLDSNIKYLELTVFDHTVDALNFPGLRNETFTTVKISAPQGGEFVVNKTQAISTGVLSNKVFFTGNSSGYAFIHAYLSVGGDHYIIIKSIGGGKLEYSQFNNTRFTQGSVFADMKQDQDMGKSLPLKSLIRKKFPEYFWRQNGANVYTITPGDTIQDDAGIEYIVDSVEDAGIIEDTFYIFASETLQRRIAGQQDGIYYLTCLRGNISPFPTGSGVIDNFKNFKFSQPVSRLYPLNYRNDPLWFKNSGTTNEEKDYYAQLIDPPQAYSAADNYVHGSVTVNDYKNSTTRETVSDLIFQPAFNINPYTGSNAIKAKLGNATSGSENRLIPIAGDNTVESQQRYYVELRRPSIARAGNHTFEYLGFGPGNYSTGLPARQEVVLTPDEDFYAQSKKEDGGIVFYTGINSQGDLYIGNRRINAITGEETFIDRATLEDDGDEDDVIGGLVTTFDTPVTFNQSFTVVGGDGTLVSTFESPVTIAVQDKNLTVNRHSLIIRSNVSSVDPVPVDQGGEGQQDEGLDRTSFSPPTKGDIRLSKNRIDAAIFAFNPRGNGQTYKIQTHTAGSVASNITPNQNPLISAAGTRIAETQFISYGGVSPQTGDILLKGSEIGKNGSLGWILSNYYQVIPDDSIFTLSSVGTNVLKINFRAASTQTPLKAKDIGITSNSQIRIKNFYPDPRINLTWLVYNNPIDVFDGEKTYVYIQVNDPIAQATYNWADIQLQTPTPPDPTVPTSFPTIEFSNSSWKELGVIGSESLRTETETIGNYKLGINTVARAAHDAYKTAFVDPATTDPRANLDIVGKTFISGKTLSTTSTGWLSNATPSARTFNSLADALVVGGDSLAPTNYSTLRVDTRTVAITEDLRGNNLGRVGINTDETVTDKLLDRALVVVGDSRFTEDARFERDIEVYTDSGTDTGEIRTGITTGSFNLLNGSTSTEFNGQLIGIGGAALVIDGTGVLSKTNSKGLRFGNNLAYIEIGDAYDEDQFIFIGNSSGHSNIFIGDNDDGADKLSKIQIGGAYGNNSSNSYTTFGTKRVNFAGDVVFGANKVFGGDRTNPEMNIAVGTEAGIVEFFGGNTQTLDFATNASEINIGGQGGTTKIRNNFLADGSARFNSNITMCGGFASFSFTGTRAQLGSNIKAHTSGILGLNSYLQNADLLNVYVITAINQNIPTALELNAGFNRIDTAGAGAWGGNSGNSNFQVAIPGAGAEGGALPALTGTDNYYLPMKYKPTPYFQAGDYIVIDSVITGTGETGTHPELCRITEDGLQGAETAPYYIKVRRQPIGKFTSIKTNHPDTTNVWKANISFGSTWITESLDNTGASENVKLAEFGGNLTTNDYVIVSRSVGATESRSSSGTTRTITTSIPHGLPYYPNTITPTLNDSIGINITGMSASYNATNVTVRTTSETSFTYTASTSLTEATTADVTGSVAYGEIFKVAVLTDLVSKKFRIINGCDTSAPNVIFSVDSVTGDVQYGDPNSQTSLTNLYGSLKILGGCGVSPIVNDIFDENSGVSDDSKLTLSNRSFNTFEVNTCNGNTYIGSKWAWVWALNGFTTDQTGIITTNRPTHSITSPVYVYTKDPQIEQSNGPLTTLTVSLGAGNINEIRVASISGFSKGDLIAIYSTGNQQFEICRITDTPNVQMISPFPGEAAQAVSILPIIYNNDYPASGIANSSIPVAQGGGLLYPNGGRGQEGTVAQTFSGGSTVVKISKDSRSTTLLEAIPSTGREPAPAPYNTDPNRIVLKLVNGDLVSQKLDNDQFIRIGSEIFVLDSIDGNPDPAFVSKMPKSIRTAAVSLLNPEANIKRYFGGGKTYVEDDLNINGGNFRMFGTDNQSIVFSIANDDGHPGDGSTIDAYTGFQGMYLKGNAQILGTIRVFEQTCKEFGTCSNELKFQVFNQTGNVDMGEKLYIKGTISGQGDLTKEVLKIDNLGPAGFAAGGTNTGLDTRRAFTMYQDGSIDAFGINRYLNKNGGRRWSYLPQATTGAGFEQANPLKPNMNYIINTSSSGNMIVYLPSTDVITGDMIRFIDVGGTLSYRASLVIRANPIGTTAVAIQGDTTGSKAAPGGSEPLLVAYPSGELIVQTRNAAFGLLYVGNTDAPGDSSAGGSTEIPPDLRGWWLVEL